MTSSASDPRLAALGGAPAFAAPLWVTRSLAPDMSTFEGHVREIFASRWFTNDGSRVRALEARLAERMEAEFCVLFCNGTVALQVALRALALTGEVITTPFTFPATVHAIQWNGLAPVFCDIDPATYNLDPLRVAEGVTAYTRGVLPVHVFGNPCAVEPFAKLAIDRRVRLLYDAAHGFDVRALGRPIGAWGDLSVFSFHATKLFHTAEGGAIVGSDPALRDQLVSLRNFGIVDEDTVRGVGLNGKMSEVHAAIGLALLDRIDDEVRARRALFERYRSDLAGLPGLSFQVRAPETDPNFSYFTVEIDPERFGLTRDELHRALRAENVFARKYFFPLCSENESYRALPTARPDHLPHAHRLAQRILCLPIFGEMDLPAAERIADLVHRIHAHAPEVRRALATPRA